MRSKFKWIFTLLVALTVQLSFAQGKTVSGVVSDASGTLPGANVIVKGTNRGTQTDIDGKYTIQVNAGETLVFSFVGMTDKEIAVGASNTVNVVLDTGVKLTEVVVEGYRSTTKATTVVAQQTVSAKTIENRPNASFVQTLQGQVAGVNIATGSGQPGASSSVLIRGAGSITGNTEPLYVIDGMPTQTTNFRSINPEDIESVTVLKDAAATAIYGNRGSNGVVVIKTRRGSSEDGKMSIRASMNTGITTLQNTRYSFANARELLTLENIVGRGRGSTLTPQEIAAWNIDTDWVDYFFRDATSTNYQLSIENSGKLLNSYTSVGYTDQEGLLNTTGLKRFSFRNNLSGKSNNNKFEYNTSMSVVFTRNNEATNLGTGAVNRNYVLGATLSAPYISPDEYENSQQLLDLYNGDGTLLYTPLFLVDKLNTYYNRTDELRIVASADARYEIAKDFGALSRTSVDMLSQRFVQAEFPVSFNALVFQNDGEEYVGFEDIRSSRTYRFSQLWQLDFTKTVDELHTFSLIGATEYNMTESSSNFQRQNGLDPAVFVPDTGVGYIEDPSGTDGSAASDFYVPLISNSRAKVNLISYFGTFDYDFDKRFGIVASYRYDGSSRFGKDYRWGSFWSVGYRWNLDNEKFLKDSKFVQVLKLRASYGVTGNQNIFGGELSGTNPPAFLSTYGLTSAVYNGESGVGVSLGVADIRWEPTYQSNFGVDFEVAKNRIRGTVDVYKKETRDLFYTSPIPPYTGDTSITQNSDLTVTNRGIEATLAVDLIRNTDMKFTVRGNMSYNENFVSGLELPVIDGNFITRNDGQVFEYYTIPYAGVNPVNGNLLFLTADGSLTETPGEADRRISNKSETPIYQGAFGFDFDYKGFFVSTNFTFAQQVWRFDFDLDGLYDSTTAGLGQFTVTDDLLNAWTPTNTNTNVPSLNASNLGEASNSDRFLRDASYVRLRYAQVGYRVPSRFLDKTFMSNLTLYVQGENLYTWTNWQGFDAESNRAGDQAQYPTPRIVTVGLDLRF